MTTSPPPHLPSPTRSDAVTVWRAGVDAVSPDVLMRRAVRIEDGRLILAAQTATSPPPLNIHLSPIRSIAVVGAGKAGAAMAAALENILGDRLLDEKQVHGWVNVPADCVKPLRRIHLHPARPAGVNEPTEAGVHGAREILKIVQALGPDDLVLCLISGGGSALLPCPVDGSAPPPANRASGGVAAGVTLADKLAVTRFLSAAGASIHELNAVRKRLSCIKGGRLARVSRAGRLVSLIISDVIGDPLDLIASGPTAPDSGTYAEALAVLERYVAQGRTLDERHERPDLRRVIDLLRARADEDRRQPGRQTPFPNNVTNLIIGSNRTAVEAAAVKARGLGYDVLDLGSDRQGFAEEVGEELARRAVELRDRRRRETTQPVCILSGGEPVVRLVPNPGKGGRNQQLVLAALQSLWDDAMRGIVLLGGGTDGEDGPTDAAGAIADAELLAEAKRRGLDPADYLARNDAYHFFEPLGGLLKTGPTGTNVMDLRVALVSAPP